jgi:hypothetical protein
MDRILKQKKKVKYEHPLAEIIEQHRYVYVYGRPGIGKTYTLNRIFPEFIEVTSEILKSKQSTTDFFERLESSVLPVVIDDYDSLEELVGLREISGVVSQGPLVIVGNKLATLEGKPYIYEFPPMPVHEIMKLASGSTVERNAILCQGDIRRFFQAVLYKSDDPDDFRSPKQVIESLIGLNGKDKTSTLFGNYFEEHGNMLGLIHQNYSNAAVSNLISITESLSLSDVIDTKLYEGDWHLLPYFFVEGIISTTFHIGHTAETIQPASIWTKDLNMRMRDKKLRTIRNRIPECSVGHDELTLIARYINSDPEKAKELARYYKLTSEDIDVINHLHKLKTRNATLLKKECRELTTTQRKKNTST